MDERVASASAWPPDGVFQVLDRRGAPLRGANLRPTSGRIEVTLAYSAARCSEPGPLGVLGPESELLNRPTPQPQRPRLAGRGQGQASSVAVAGSEPAAPVLGARSLTFPKIALPLENKGV